MNVKLLKRHSGEYYRLNEFSIIQRSGSMQMSEMNSEYHKLRFFLCI